MSRFGPIAFAGAIVLMAAVLYVPALGEAPVYLGGDEAHFGVQGHSLATTGRDTNGRFLPFFINVHGPLGPHQPSTRWYQPLNFYAIALSLKVFPLAEWSIRLPMAIVGVLNVALVSVLALRLFGRPGDAAFAALLLAMTPAHFLLARQALDYVLPLPFALVSLLCVQRAKETGSTASGVMAGLALGVGLFSYIAAWVLFPMLAVLAVVVLLLAQRVTSSVALLVGFLLPALILVLWVWTEPTMLSTTLGRYATPGAAQLSPLQRVREFFTFGNIEEKVAIYWENFNPSFLFLSGSSGLTVSTRQAGVFLLPTLVFLVCGLYDRVKHVRDAPLGLLLVGGFLCAAIPPTLASERYAFQREAAALPFAVLLATYGFAALITSPRRVVRAVAIVLVLMLPLQFAVFYRDYFGDYQARSAFWFDQNNFRDVTSYLIAQADRENLPKVYFAENLDDVGARWGFYLRKHDRIELWERTAYYRAEIFDEASVIPNSVMVLDPRDQAIANLTSRGQWVLEHTVPDVTTGNPAAILLRRH